MSMGVCNIGVAKQLSTTKTISVPAFKSLSACMSISSKPGLEGLSQNMNFVLGLIALFQAPKSLPVTKVHSMPHFVVILVNI